MPHREMMAKKLGFTEEKAADPSTDPSLLEKMANEHLVPERIWRIAEKNPSLPEGPVRRRIFQGEPSGFNHPTSLLVLFNTDQQEIIWSMFAIFRCFSSFARDVSVLNEYGKQSMSVVMPMLWENATPAYKLGFMRMLPVFEKNQPRDVVDVHQRFVAALARFLALLDYKEIEIAVRPFVDHHKMPVLDMYVEKMLASSKVQQDDILLSFFSLAKRYEDPPRNEIVQDWYDSILSIGGVGPEVSYPSEEMEEALGKIVVDLFPEAPLLGRLA